MVAPYDISRTGTGDRGRRSSGHEQGYRLMRLTVVLIGLAAFILSACSSESANKAIMDVVARYDGKQRPSDRWKTSCGDIPWVSARYCLHQTGPNPKYTIWFFHGAGDSERVFQVSAFDQESYFQFENDLPPVNIVTLSYGPIWTLAPSRSLDPTDATIEVFTSKIMPFIDESFGLAHRPRVAMGHSQGGLNVATLCAALPESWAKCVLLNPMLPGCDPFHAWPICPTIFSRLGAFGPNFLIRANYSRLEWQKSQPLVLLKNARCLPSVVSRN